MAQQQKTKSGNIVPERKIKEVKEIDNLVKNSRTVLVASIKNIPASQFQEIVKNLRGKVSVKVPKKTILFRALDNNSSEEVEKLKQRISESYAILFSSMGPFELARELIKNQRPAAAKPGQAAPEDIEVEEGSTELPPGPAISELGALGLKTQVQKGKIHISESKVVVKEGEEISSEAANVLSKLEKKPFKIGFIPLCAFDKESGTFYEEIKIDPEEAKEDLKSLYGKAVAFAVEMNYASNDTITFLLGKAIAHERALSDKTGTGENTEGSEGSSESSESQEESQSSNSEEGQDSGSNGSSESSEETEKPKKEEGENK